ncbi:MAG: DUF421 domain-containing protein [Alphaproteobacteria bacterium]|nr:DUF421 domain-containing protein [Alphaproteobacteria bacterium]
MFFDGWNDIGRIVLVGVLSYAALVVLLRVSGKRTLSKMNSFDFVVTIAFGSTLAAIMLNRSISLSEGVTALALLVILQYAVTWLSVRSKFVERIVKDEPTLLLFHGQPLEFAMRKERVSLDEMQAAVRSEGLEDFSCVAAVILETDGKLSIIPGGRREAGRVLKEQSPPDASWQRVKPD